jgi:hypothetical protein
MKINGKQEPLARVARRGLLPAVLFAMVVSVSAISKTQSSGISASARELRVAAGPSNGAQAPTQAAKPKSVPSEASRQERTPAKGQHEGITVHGHWTIEVHNPDNSLEKRLQFENELQPAAGGFILSSLVAGNSVSGGLAVGVNTSYTTGTPKMIFSTPEAPLIHVNDASFSLFTLGETGPCSVAISGPGTVQPNGCLMFQANFNSFPEFCFFIQDTNNQGLSSLNQNCFPNLQVTAPIWSGGKPATNTPSITLAGSFLASATYPITDVETWVLVCTPDSLPSTCANIASFEGTAVGQPTTVFPAGIVPPLPAGNQLMLLTARNLDGMNGDPSKVPITAGQTVSVTVVLSFQ